jgi:hypothetical protein
VAKSGAVEGESEDEQAATSNTAASRDNCAANGGRRCIEGLRGERIGGNATGVVRHAVGHKIGGGVAFIHPSMDGFLP